MAMIRLKVTNTGEYAQERAGHYLPPDSTVEVVVSEYEELQFTASETLRAERVEDDVDMTKPVVLAGAPGRLPQASDSAKELAAEHGVGLAGVEGTGSGGRITVNDVRREVAALGLELEGPHQNAPVGARRAHVVEPHVQTPDLSHDRLEISRANKNVEVPDTGRHVLEQHNPAPPNTHREIPDLVFDSKEVMPVADMSYEERHEVDPGVRTEGNVAEGVAPPLGNFPERAEEAEETDLDPTGRADTHEDAGTTPFPQGAARGSTRAANRREAQEEIREKGLGSRAEAMQQRETETRERLAEDERVVRQQELDRQKERSDRMGLTPPEEDAPKAEKPSASGEVPGNPRNEAPAETDPNATEESSEEEESS